MDGQLSEGTVRLAIFLSVFAAMAALELLSPRLERQELAGALKTKRWLANLSLVVLSSIMLRLVFPAAAVGVALYAKTQGWGLLRWLDINPIVGGMVAFAALDFAVWLEHLASHKIPLLWRIHRVHHTDTGLDVTSGLRFHPLEIIVSMIWKAIVVALLGPPVVAVLVFEIVLNATSMFNHANIRLPLALDRIVRLVLVTPDMHRVHHSVEREETDSNYGFNLPIWDRLFGT
ncbi:MAG: sterol desaturase family protein, partial [Mesorhizobium sp.]